MFERFVNLVRSIFGALLVRAEDPQLILEQAYQDLNANLLKVRQAVVQAIATEKQIGQQLQKNQEQVQNWHNRATLAVQQGQDDLARQALQRRQQHLLATSEQEKLLNSQHESVESLRHKLADLEEEVQKAYFKKQDLINKDKYAQATGKANELLSKVTANGALSIMDRMEEKVQERLAKSEALAELSGDSLEKQFKSIEGRTDIEADLTAIKTGLTLGSTKIEIKEPKLLEENVASAEMIEAKDVIPEED